MQQRLKRAIRKVVLKTNTLPVLGRLNRSVYHLAVRLLIFRYRGLRGVRALYARSSYARGDFVPGLNDIDLIVLIDDDLTTAEEFEILGEVDRVYGKIRTLFPMLGESVRSLNLEHFAVYTKYGASAYESKDSRRTLCDGLSGWPSWAE